MARILLATFGSYGDLFPYLSIGRELRIRGHEVAIATSVTYQSKVQAEGLHFYSVRPDVSLDDKEMLAYILDRRRGTERIVRHLAEIVEESYEDTLPPVRDWADLVVTHPITYGAVLAARKTGKPWVSSVLAPISFISAYDPPVPANAPWLHGIRHLGPGAMRVIWNLGRKVSRAWVQPLIRLGEQLGLDMSASPLFEGSFSPQCVLALFSRVMGEPQPDWPNQTVITGFPFYDRTEELPEHLRRFLDSGPAPLVFTLGSSAVGVAGAFYSESLKAAEESGMRAVLLTGRFRQDLPSELPAGTILIEYAPHALLFARAAAVVHQGGIGTTAEALRSGRPMLVVPFAHDQFDNAYRVERTGAGRQVKQSSYSGQRAARLLRELMTNSEYEHAASRTAEAVRNEAGSSRAADAIESILRDSVHAANVI